MMVLTQRLPYRIIVVEAAEEAAVKSEILVTNRLNGKTDVALLARARLIEDDFKIQFRKNVFEFHAEHGLALDQHAHKIGGIFNSVSGAVGEQLIDLALELELMFI